MKRLNFLLTVSVFLGMCIQLVATPPVAPKGTKWVKIDNLSDEFDNGLDSIKWNTFDGWRGRKPGLFRGDQITVEGGNLQIPTGLLPDSLKKDDWTHFGGFVGSNYPAMPEYSGYYECRMKANKTFMSSTFWLFNRKSEGSSCDKRITELDIQECVGYVNTTKEWAQSFDQAIHSNTHSRGVSCETTPVGTKGNNAPIDGKVWADYHTYAVWWKSPTEVWVYLDNVKQYEITPVANFDLKMYLRMVVETYTWNPTPDDGGMTGTLEERTTYYDWVRSWQLVDCEDCDEHK